MADHPGWCSRAYCASGGAHLSSAVEVHSDPGSGLSAVVRLAQSLYGAAYVVLLLNYPGYDEEIPLCFDGGFARVLGRVLVNAGGQACALGYPQGVDNGWG